jgi:tight adherence protein C
MRVALLAGALVGLGVYFLIRAVSVPQRSLVSAVGRLDSGRRETRGSFAVPTGLRHGLPERMGSWAAREVAARGWRLGRMRADLAILDRSLEGFLGRKLLLALGGLLFPTVVNVLYLVVLGTALPVVVPLWGGLFLAVIAFLIPDTMLHREAEERRRDFRHAVGSFLDLVAMNLAGGRGVPEALMSASSVGQGWAFARLRDTLANARLSGHTPWSALGQLGTDLGIDELRDLAASLTLVAEDGAKVRASLVARAATLRRRELTDSEGKAAERSQSMLVAQLVLCGAFFLFLAYPAAWRVFTT